MKTWQIDSWAAGGGCKLSPDPCWRILSVLNLPVSLSSHLSTVRLSIKSFIHYIAKTSFGRIACVFDILADEFEIKMLFSQHECINIFQMNSFTRLHIANTSM